MNTLTVDYFGTIPNDIIHIIFQNIDSLQDLFSLLFLNKRFFQLLRTNKGLWKSLCLKYWNHFKQQLTQQTGENYSKEQKIYSIEGVKKIIGDNKEKIDELIKLFLDKTPELWIELMDSYDKGDLLNVSNVAHKIKPTLDMLLANSLTQVIRNIESFAKENDKEGQLLDNITFCETELNKLYTQLNEDLKK